MAITERQRRYALWLVEHPAQFGRLLGFTKLGDIHDGWMRNMLTGDDDMTLLAHRLSYKTTCVSIVIAIYAIVAPRMRLFFMRKTDDDVKEIVAQVQKILVSAVAMRFASEIWGVTLTLDECNATKITTCLAADMRGASQITAQGIGGSITGKHFDRIFTDDIVSMTDRVSKAERDRTKLIYMELQNIRNPGCRIINTGTPWHKDDAISGMPNVQMFDCYSTGIMDAAEIDEKRSSMTPQLFAANYELKHIAAENVLFGAPHYTDDAESIFDGIAHIDAAYGGADGTAFTILRKRADGKYTGFGKLWHKHVDDCIDEILAIKQRMRAGSTTCEDNADKGYLRKELRRRGDTVTGYHESMNKYVKISSYLRKEWDRIEWLRETDGDYINEILDYTEGAEHDDAPDSAASLVRKLTYKKTDAGGEPVFW